MSIALILALCMAGITCVTPLTLYLFWLGHINRREQPSVVSGVWDFMALLMGLSGFLLCGTILVLTSVAAGSHIWTGHTFEQLSRSWGQDYSIWVISLLLYIALLTGVILGTLYSRRRSLGVYNASLEGVDAAIERVFKLQGRVVLRNGNLWSTPEGQPLVEVIPFHALRHIQVKWLMSDPRMREECDRQLRVAMSQQLSPENPMAQWVMTSAISGFISILCFVVLVGVAVFSGGR